MPFGMFKLPLVPISIESKLTHESKPFKKAQVPMLVRFGMETEVSAWLE